MELMGSRGSIPASVSPIFCHPWKIAVGLPAQDCAGWDWDERSGDQAGGRGGPAPPFPPGLFAFAEMSGERSRSG